MHPYIYRGRTSSPGQL